MTAIHRYLVALLLGLSLAAATQPCVAQAASETPADTLAARPNPDRVAAAIRATAAKDSRIASDVAAVLLRQPTLSQVQVSVHAGVVTLAGTVLEEPDRTRAETLARQVPGVIDVINATRLDASLGIRFQQALDQVDGKFVRLLAATPLLIAAIVIVLLSMWLGRYLATRRNPLRLRSGNPYMDGLVRRIVQTVVILIGLLIALDLLGATSLVGAVLGSAGVVGLVIGFAFRDIAENYIAGILLSLRRPFAPGDHLFIDKYEGKVVALTSRATLLMTLDGSQLSLPNALVFKSVVLNYSVNPNRRFDFVLPIDPSESVREAQELGIKAIAGIDGVLTDPAPSWAVDGYVTKGIDLRFYGWVDQRRSDLGKVRSEAVRAAKGAFGRAGIHGPETVRYRAPGEPASGSRRAVTPASESGGDTSVNRDIDRQLAAAQRATDVQNLLDPAETPEGGARPSTTPDPRPPDTP